MSTLHNRNAGEVITSVLLISVTPLDTMTGGMEAKKSSLFEMTFWPSHSDPGLREKINLDFHFA